jgi:AcrR family transcriptional regulator
VARCRRGPVRSRALPSTRMIKQMKTQKKIAPAGEPNRLGEIYRTAAQLICEKGYDATSMSEIADALGITKAGIYHYIAGKQDLLFGIMSYGMDLLEEHVITPTRAIAEAEPRLRAIVRSHALLITRGTNAVTILMDEVAGLTAAHRRKIIQRKRSYMDYVRETLTQLQAEGKLRDVDLTVATFSLFGMVLWLSRWYRRGGRLTNEQVAEEITKLVLGGLLRPTARLARR